MQIPLSWIKEFIDLNATPDEIAKMLTMIGVEVDRYETIAHNWTGVVVGHVLEVEKHPQADKLVVAVVSDGKELHQVVCGAPNCRPGLKTAFALVGANLKDENGKEFTIKKTKIRGVESSGMLCSGVELQVSDDDDGILELPENTPLGIPLNELYKDIIFEISLTPNLGHCASVLGIARELSAVTGLPLHTPPDLIEKKEQTNQSAPIKLTLLDQDGCPRYTCRLIKDVQIGPSPHWLRSRLEKCGLRSVNNVVDITNYVLMERGHPLHAFDYDQLEGHEIVVRKAQEGEHFKTLDDKDRLLISQDLLICDAKKPIALAGVMGGANSEVSSQTRNILLESAYFDPVTIRKTSKRLGLQTDSSKRFERGCDPNSLILALNRATSLIQDFAGGAISGDLVEIKVKDFPEKLITCRLKRVNQVLGTQLSQGEIEEIFRRLNFHCYWKEDHCVVHVPTYRVDIHSEIDLIEEVIRFYGYDKIVRKESYYQSSKLPHVPIYLFENEVRSRLISAGLQEFLTCDLIGPSLLEIVQDESMPKDFLVSVLNPTSVEQSILRTSLLPGLLQVVKYNIDHQNDQMSGFELGRIHFKDGNQFKEPSVGAIILSGKSHLHHWDIKPKDYDFFDLKGIVESLLNELGIVNYKFKNLEMQTFHSGRQASIFVDSLEIGSIGEIHPAIMRRLDVTQRILFGEFNLHDLMQVSKHKEKVVDLPIYPASERDWTFTIQTDVPFEDIIQSIYEQNSPLLENVSLLDIYRSPKLGEDFQNMTLHFVYRDSSKTVAQEVVDAEHQRLIAGVLEKFDDAIKTAS